MKVLFKQMIQGYIGNADDLIFYWDPRLQRILARRKPKMRITQNNLKFAAISKNLMALNPSERYKDDLRTYAERTYNVPEFGGVRPQWNNLYLRIMYRMKDVLPGMDLATLTREIIVAGDLPCVTVKRAVEEGFLPQVRGWDALTAEM